MKRAVLICCSYYLESYRDSLDGCISDMYNMYYLLDSFGFYIKIVTDIPIDNDFDITQKHKAFIKKKYKQNRYLNISTLSDVINWLLYADNMFLYFTGHANKQKLHISENINFSFPFNKMKSEQSIFIILDTCNAPSLNLPLQYVKNKWISNKDHVDISTYNNKNITLLCSSSNKSYSHSTEGSILTRCWNIVMKDSNTCVYRNIVNILSILCDKMQNECNEGDLTFTTPRLYSTYRYDKFPLWVYTKTDKDNMIFYI